MQILFDLLPLNCILPNREENELQYVLTYFQQI